MMKLFSFWRKQPAAAPNITATPLPTPNAAPRPAITLLPLLILKVVQAFPNRGEDRALRRFFEKTNIAPGQVSQWKNYLYENGLLQTGPVKQGIQYFVPSARGLAFLDEQYDQEIMIAYVLELEPKGFIATLLRNVADKKQPES